MMTTALATTAQQRELKRMLDSDSVQARLAQCLGARGPQFATSILSLVSASDQLRACRPETVLAAAMQAATLDLPVQKDLGFAYIVPYKAEAQFQMGYRGFVQLAMRSGQYARMNAAIVTEGAFLGYDDIGEPRIDWSAIDPDGEAVGYAFAFRLVNGFAKLAYWPRAKVEAHARRYSQAYRYDVDRGKQSSPWSTNFDAMALKTVIKLTLSHWGVLSVEMQDAIRADQAASDGEETAYVDNGAALSDPAAEQAATALFAVPAAGADSDADLRPAPPPPLAPDATPDHARRPNRAKLAEAIESVGLTEGGVTSFARVMEWIGDDGTIMDIDRDVLWGIVENPQELADAMHAADQE